MSRSLGLLVLVAGCGDPDPGVSDASPPDALLIDYDFSCLDQDPPTTAPDPTTIGGTIRDFADVQGVAGVAVDVIRDSDAAVLGSAVTDASGQYQLTVATGGAAFEVARRLTATGFVTTRVYGPAILSGPQSLQNLLLTTSEHAAFASAFGVAEDPQRGAITTVIRDCANTPVVGAQIVIPAADDIGYLDGGLAAPDLDRTGSDGIAVAWGVPPGPATVAVVYGANTWRQRAVVVEANGVVLSFRAP